MDMSPYRDLFVSEARSHLYAFSELIVRLEVSRNDSSVIDELFRHAHSLKGMAATMEYEQVVAITHLMESLLSRIRNGEFLLLPPLADLFLEGSDTLARLVSVIEEAGDAFEDTTSLTERLAAFDPSPEAAVNQPHEGAEVPREANSSASPRSSQSDSFKSIRIRTELLDHLVNITGELFTTRYHLAESIRNSDAAECKEPLHQLTLLLHNLRDEVFKARMLPFAIIAERFPRLVRDLARKLGKEVHFQLEGKDIELDRGILEEIAEPIVHILRNAVDHGLEFPDERALAGKPSGGILTLTVLRDKDHIEISIADDGRGMDPERLKLKAIEKELLSTGNAGRMSPQEAYQLICMPGFSTAATVTDISGRGVGMDAVCAAIQALSGALIIHSQTGQGSRFVLRLPLTVSIIHALIVRCGLFDIAFPLSVVTGALELNHSKIREEAGQPTIILDGSPVPLRSLSQALKLPENPQAGDALQPIIVCDVGGMPFAFSVESIIGQQEIFVRPLHTPLSHLYGFSGATVTGDGRVLFVADANKLARP